MGREKSLYRILIKLNLNKAYGDVVDTDSYDKQIDENEQEAQRLRNNGLTIGIETSQITISVI